MFKIGKFHMNLKYFKFSKKELIHLAVSTIALSFAFALILYRNEIYANGFNFRLIFFINSLIIVGFAFILHEELGHKLVAQKYGLWAEYRAWPTGLFFAVALAVMSRGGFVFAAPGAVMISNVKKSGLGYEYINVSDEKMGKIGIAGSVVNIALAIIFLILTMFFASEVFSLAATVNVWLALFNMIPFGPLDGAKVMNWSKKIWVLTIGVCLALFFTIPFF